MAVMKDEWLDFPGRTSFSYQLRELLSDAGSVVSYYREKYPFDPAAGLRVYLESLLEHDDGSRMHAKCRTVVSSLKAYFYQADPDKPESNDGRIIVVLSDDQLSAHLTVLPPRGVGNMPTINTVHDALNAERVIFGVDDAVIDKALRTVREAGDIVWNAVIARGEAPTEPGLRTVKYTVSVVDKVELRENMKLAEEALSTPLEPVRSGDRIGYLLDPEPGLPGRDVCGRIVPASHEAKTIRISDDIQLKPDGELIVIVNGYVMADSDRVDVVPLFVVENPVPGSVNDFHFAGSVLVRGSLQGPGSISCDNLFVLGNCEQMKISCNDDVFVTRGVIGHNNTVIEADGGIYCGFASEAKLSALGEVMAENALMNSEVVSNDIIRVTSQKGIIAGGKVSSLKEVIAATIGSEFGMMTDVSVGKEFLVAERLNAMSAKIALHEETLQRIEVLKGEVAKSKVPLEQLPQDKQDIFIGILRKEEAARAELKSLTRKKEIIDRKVGDFIEASVSVLDNLYPPSRIRILDAISDIREKMQAVTLRYDNNKVITSQKEIVHASN